MSNYTVCTRDIDTCGRRHYATIEKAMARFEEMAGHTLAAAMAEQFHEVEPERRPTVRAVKSVRAVSKYGTVVVFLRNCEPEAEPVAAAAPAPELDYDELAAKAAELREGIDATLESAAERLGQYQSECAMFGDAGPGQHPSCWADRSAGVLAEARTELAAVLAAMEVLRPGAAKAAADAEAAAWAAECADAF